MSRPVTVATCSFCADTGPEGCVFCGGTGTIVTPPEEYHPAHDLPDWWQFEPQPPLMAGWDDGDHDDD